MTFAEALNLGGAIAFGLVIGWVTSGILRRSKREALSDISTVVAAIGGAAITGLFAKETGAFGAYSIGLAVGFFVYIVVAIQPTSPDWLGEQPGAQGGGGNSGGGKLPDIA
ncbi:MAG TPA: hypothetical protein VMG08_06765 [Allosphingosinicella sp.]|nr:hypothetical protein [Allosphingosinicella sp.]